MPKHTLLCMRASDMARVHPETDWSHKCERCGESIGVYPSGQRVIARLGRANIILVCNRCQQPGPVAVLAPGAEYELSQTTRKQ